MEDIHLFIIWSEGIDQKDKIVEAISENFTICSIYNTTWSENRFSNNLSRLYGENLPKNSNKEKHCGTDTFYCIIVKDNRIISVGYNGFLAGAQHKSIIQNNHEQATIHAEQNAICDCAKRGVSCNDCVVYVTHYPCIICCRLLLASGIKTIKYIEDYKNDELVEYFCKQKEVNLEKLVN